MTKPNTVAAYHSWLRDGALTSPSVDVLQFMKDAVTALDHAAVYMSVCPPPADLSSEARKVMDQRKEFIDRTRGTLGCRTVTEVSSNPGCLRGGTTVETTHWPEVTKDQVEKIDALVKSEFDKGDWRAVEKE